MPQQRSTLSRPATILMTVLVLAGVFYLRADYNLHRIDYRNSNFVFFWLAGRMVVSGENPYDAVAWRAQLAANNVSWRPDQNFLYPLPLAFLLAPLGLASLGNAYLLWQIVSQALIALSVWALLAVSPDPRHRRMFFPFVIALLFFGPVYLSLQIGALGAFTLAALAAAIIALDHKHHLLAGVLLAFLLLKPPQALPILALAGVWIIARSAWKAFIGLSLGASSLLLIGMLGDPLWLSKFAAVGQALMDRSLGVQSNVLSLAYRACGGDLGCMWVYGGIASLVLLLLAGTYVWQHRNDLTAWEAFGLIIPAAFLTTPYLWSYDQILYVIPVAWIAVRLVDRTRGYLAPIIFMSALVLGSIVALLIFARTRSDLASLLTTGLVAASAISLKAASRTPDTHTRSA